MRTLSIETVTHGRVLVEDAADVFSGLLVGFHGYAQSAEEMLDELRRLPGSSRWRIAAVQALHRFYSRGEQRVVASWMTREDRDLAIADNLAYVDAAVARIAGASHAGLDLAAPRDFPPPIVYVGFSQGTSMAYRAAVRGRHRAAGVIALGGDIPPELKEDDSGAWPPVLIGVGSTETWYTSEKLDADTAFLASRGAQFEVVRFDGGHEWTDEFRREAGRWLEQRPAGP